MSGAIALAGKAALLAGTGLVRLAVPESILETVAALAPEPMTAPLSDDRKGRIAFDAEPEIRALLSRATAVALGPGLGRSLGLDALVARLYVSVACPMIVDADALNALASRGGPAALPSPGGLRILTPHPGEFERLCPGGMETQEQRAVEFAKRSGVLLVLKGHRTFLTDGLDTARNDTGNPGMGTGGSGDVLTGLLAGLLAQPFLKDFDAFELVRLGVHLHGLAGDLAAGHLGETSVTAGALLDFLPQALKSV